MNSFNHVLKNKIENIKIEYDELIEEYKTNNLLYGAKYDFEPVIGETYHLYQKKNEENSFLSMIPPQAWNKPYVGSFKLNIDKVWIKTSN